MKIAGQDVESLKNQLLAIVLNTVSWLLSWLPRALAAKLSPAPSSGLWDGKDEDFCVAIQGPGGLDQLQVINIPGTAGSPRATVGYNVPSVKGPFVPNVYAKLEPNLVIVRNKFFSINYADVCIRWGLYESALRFVGWPIVPGFDFAGTVEWAGVDSGFKPGDEVFGFSLFGTYSSRLIVPSNQIWKRPQKLSTEIAAALPAVAATALHAVALAGGCMGSINTSNKAVLIHSAAGGVGSMIIQLCKVAGFHPIVAVVGASHKAAMCTELGATFVIDKSKDPDLWTEARRISPDGYVAIFDANGVSTLSDSYENLCKCGRLVVYGFHTNLPKVSDFISPFSWARMLYDMFRMPRFDAMAMTLDSKGVLGFNLSFFADEKVLIEKYMKMIMDLVESGKLKVASVKVFPMQDVAQAHALIQSGQSVGKIVCEVPQIDSSSIYTRSNTKE